MPVIKYRFRSELSCRAARFSYGIGNVYPAAFGGGRYGWDLANCHVGRLVFILVYVPKTAAERAERVAEYLPFSFSDRVIFSSAVKKTGVSDGFFSG